MNKIAYCIALAMTASISTVALAARHMPVNDNVPQCKAQLKDVHGHKATAYFLRTDCERLSDIKKGESIKMISIADEDLAEL